MRREEEARFHSEEPIQLADCEVCEHASMLPLSLSVKPTAKMVKSQQFY